MRSPPCARAAQWPRYRRLRFPSYPPFPNPLEGSCTLRFDLARAGTAALEVFDLSGRRVARLDHGLKEPGRYSIRWAGKDDRGGPAATGLYFVRLTGPNHDIQTARLVIAR